MPSKFLYIVPESRIPANLIAGHLEVAGSNPFHTINSEIARVLFGLRTVPSHCSDPVPGSGDFQGAAGCVTCENEYLQVSRGYDAFNERPGPVAEDPHH